MGEWERNRVAEKRFVATLMVKQEVIVAPEISPEEGRNSTRPNSTLDLKSIPINPHDRNYRCHKPNFVRSVISSSDHPEEEAYAASHDCVRHQVDCIPVERGPQRGRGRGGAAFRSGFGSSLAFRGWRGRYDSLGYGFPEQEGQGQWGLLGD